MESFILTTDEKRIIIDEMKKSYAYDTLTSLSGRKRSEEYISSSLFGSYPFDQNIKYIYNIAELEIPPVIENIIKEGWNRTLKEETTSKRDCCPEISCDIGESCDIGKSCDVGESCNVGESCDQTLVVNKRPLYVSCQYDEEVDILDVYFVEHSKLPFLIETTNEIDQGKMFLTQDKEGRILKLTILKASKTLVN